MTSVPQQFREEDHPRAVTGRFETKTREEGAVEPLKLYDRDGGTFLSPPASKTADHCVRFWSTVEIPDAIVVAFHDAHAIERQQRVDAAWKQEQAAWGDAWRPNNPEPQAATDAHREWNERRNASWQQHATELGLKAKIESEHPKLKRQDVGQAIRATQMIRYAPDPDRFLDETVKVLEFQVETLQGEMTTREVAKRYNLVSIEGILDRMPEKAPEGINQELVAALQQLSQQVAGVNYGVGSIMTSSSQVRDHITQGY